jgi:hypothetical protein
MNAIYDITMLTRLNAIFLITLRGFVQSTKIKSFREVIIEAPDSNTDQAIFDRNI